MMSAVLGVEDVSAMSFRDVIAWRADVGEPGAETLVEALMEAIRTAPPGDLDALQQALTATVTQTNPLLPSSKRIPDRDLVQALSGGQRATAGELEAGAFQVSAMVNGEPWWVVLDIEPADIVMAIAMGEG